MNSGLDAAATLLESLFGGLRDRRGWVVVVEVHGHNWRSPKPHYLRLSEETDFRAELERWYEEGSEQEWYVAPNLFARASWRAEDFLCAPALFLDLDDSSTHGPFELSPPPSFAVETSPSRFHCFWLLQTPLEDRRKFEDLNRRLTYATGADRSGWDPAQLLRLPLGVNAKRKPHFRPHLLICRPDLVHPIDRFESLPQPPNVSKDVEDTPLPEPLSETERREALERIRSAGSLKLRRILEQEQADRSKALWYAYHELASLGVSARTAFWLLREGPNDKFADRRYGAAEALWRDVLQGYRSAEAAAKAPVAERIKALRVKRGEPAAQKMLAIGREILSDLRAFGTIYRVRAAEGAVHLDAATGEVTPLSRHSTKLKKLLLDRYGIDPASKEFASVAEQLAAAAVDEELVDLRRLAYYDAVTNALWLNRFDGRIVRVSVDDVAVLPNGADGVLFAGYGNAAPYRVLVPPDPKAELLDLVSAANVPEAYRSQAYAAIVGWLVATLFGSVIPVKPVLLLHGDPGSGKTSLLKAIAATLWGPDAAPLELPEKEEDFDVVAAQSDVLLLDNVDEYRRWLSTRIALAATGYRVEKRKLYTDAEVVAYQVSTFVALTSRTPRYVREDVAERLVSIATTAEGRPYLPERVVRERWLRRRDARWGALVAAAQHVLRRLPSAPSKPREMRLADFATLLELVCEWLEVDATDVLSLISARQTEEVLAADPVAVALRYWLQKPDNRGREVTAEQLWRELLLGPYERDLLRVCRSPRGLGTKLGQLKKHFDFAVERRQSEGQWLWRFAASGLPDGEGTRRLET